MRYGGSLHKLILYQISLLTDWRACGLLNINPIKLRPTWRNKRVDVDSISNILDRFLIFSGYVEGEFETKAMSRIQRRL
jgi:hypothetical protein